MPEESKKNPHKGAKDQRKPKNRHQAGPADKKVERKGEEPKVPVQKPPVYEDPGPEFYKNLKRETDEILKITEEANSKYKKKEIQSNWSKYEMPIESYDEIEEQENMGADYEKLIEAPSSVGGHFQFKHEKSWDVDTGPSLYDKYFEVDMDNLFLSIATIPFQERLNVDQLVFSETDLLTMNNRAIRFKQKYYNNKTFTTPELTVQDSILKNLKQNIDKVEEINLDNAAVKEQEPILTEETITEQIHDLNISSIKLAPENKTETEDLTINKNYNKAETLQTLIPTPNIEPSKEVSNDFEDLIVITKENKSKSETKETAVANFSKMEKVADQPKAIEPEIPKNPVIESPEDLEKWLDNFLDG